MKESGKGITQRQERKQCRKGSESRTKYRKVVIKGCKE
jgi:hypothetical protein